jgi:hypothetical protein
MRLLRFYLTVLAVSAATLAAQDDNESFHIEVTAGGWIRDTSGTIQSGVTPVDLRSDLAIDQKATQFYGRLVLKPARRHRFVVEGVPYGLSGANNISRTITFAGRTYTVTDRVVSDADITYVSGAYQFDVVSRPAGHFGLLGGVAYVNATGTLVSQGLGFSGTESQSFPFPVAGAEFRAFPVAGRSIFSIGGEIKGMSLGSYGHFVQGIAQAGIGLGRHLTLQAGYMVADADVHRKDQTRGIAPRFTGPLFTIQIRD